MEVLTSINPANGQVLGQVPVTPVAQIAPMVAQAQQAQKAWGRLSFDERIAFIEGAAQEVQGQIEELAVLLSKEMGKDIRRSGGEVSGVAYGAAHMAQEVKQALQPENQTGGQMVYAPLGVVAVISPWNYPLAMANNLMIPALVAGNTVVFKPSEETPLIAQSYVNVLQKHLPENVLQIVHGAAPQGIALVEANVNMIAFTGSRRTGKDIMRRAANGVKRLVMELGGNDPMIVLPDADIKAAARFAVASSFENAGQMCTSTERIYVHNSVAQAFEQAVVAVAQQYKVGPWNMENVNIGPIVNLQQRQKIIDHINDAKAKGARVLLGGQNHPEHYVTPTVLADVTEHMLMEQEETFGPVVSMQTYSQVPDAVSKANHSPYGLGAVVFGHEQAQEVAGQLEAGMVGINTSVGAGGAPWVGAKQSGFGFHGSAQGHRQFAQVKVISTR